MTDRISRRRRSMNMAAIRSVDTSPEMAVRKIVHGMGYRYRLHGKELPGKPDLVFKARKKAMFVHGCFWHQHTNCIDGRKPASNTDYWLPKLKRNIERDRLQSITLKKLGWKILIIWECQISTNDKALKRKIAKFLN